MSDVTRYRLRFLGASETTEQPDGDWVKFTDHEAAVETARVDADAQGFERGLRARWGVREAAAWNEALGKAVEAVRATASFGFDADQRLIGKNDAIAAIEGLQGGGGS